MNILITSAGQRVSLVKAFQKELKNQYPAGKVFTTDMCPYLSAACQVSDKYYRVKRVTAPDYIDELLDLCRRLHIGMVVPTIDTELMILSRNRGRFQQSGIHVVISAPALVEKCRDKRMIRDFFGQHGIDTPCPIDKNNPSFPLFIKPYDGSLSVDTFVIHNAGDLRECHYSNDKLLFMEYIDRNENDEYTVDMYYDRTGHIRCIVPRRRLLVRAGEINKGITVKNALVPYLRNKLEYIEGAAGCLTGQFFLNKSTGRIVGIEINARFGGGYPLSYRAGANYPGWLIEEYGRDRTIPYTDDWEDGLLMLRYDAEVILHQSEMHVPPGNTLVADH